MVILFPFHRMLGSKYWISATVGIFFKHLLSVQSNKNSTFVSTFIYICYLFYLKFVSFFISFILKLNKIHFCFPLFTSFFDSQFAIILFTFFDSFVAICFVVPSWIMHHNKNKTSTPWIQWTRSTQLTQAQPDIVYIQTQHPLIGLINSIGFKLSNTADFFAGMLRGTIQVIKAHRRNHNLSYRKKVSAHQSKRKPKFNYNFIKTTH